MQRPQVSNQMYKQKSYTMFSQNIVMFLWLFSSSWPGSLQVCSQDGAAVADVKSVEKYEFIKALAIKGKFKYSLQVRRVDKFGTKMTLNLNKYREFLQPVNQNRNSGSVFLRPKEIQSRR